MLTGVGRGVRFEYLISTPTRSHKIRDTGHSCCVLLLIRLSFLLSCPSCVLSTIPASRARTPPFKQMSSVIVHGPPLSPAVSRVLACLFEKEVDFQIARVEMAKGQHKSPEYLKIQPFGQVPAYQDGDVTLFESRAISRYICDKYADKGTKGLLGNNLLERASIEQWLEAESQTYNPPSSQLMFQLFFASRMGLQQDPTVIEQNEAKLDKVLDVYEKRLGESRFLAGEEFTLADLSHLPNTQYIVNNTDKGHLLTSRKNVSRWWEEISNRPAWKQVVELQNAPPS